MFALTIAIPSFARNWRRRARRNRYLLRKCWRVGFDAVFPLLNARARIPLCGLIANYNGDPAAESKYRISQLMTAL